MRSGQSPGHPSPAATADRTVPPSGHPRPTALCTSLLLSAVPSNDDTDNRGRRYDPTATSVKNPRTTSVKSLQYGLCRREFLRRRLSLDRQQFSAGPQHASRPASQPVQGSYSPRGSDIGPDLPRQVFGPPAHDTHVRQFQPLCALFEEDTPAEHRLHQDHTERRPDHSQDDSRQPGAGANIDQLTVLWQEFVHDGAIEEMPLPQTFRFPGPDEPASHPLGGQKLRVLSRLL